MKNSGEKLHQHQWWMNLRLNSGEMFLKVGPTDHSYGSPFFIWIVIWIATTVLKQCSLRKHYSLDEKKLVRNSCCASREGEWWIWCGSGQRMYSNNIMPFLFKNSLRDAFEQLRYTLCTELCTAVQFWVVTAPAPAASPIWSPEKTMNPLFLFILLHAAHLNQNFLTKLCGQESERRTTWRSPLEENRTQKVEE